MPRRSPSSIERPGEDQDRARVLPVRYLKDLGLAALQGSGSPVHATTSAPAEILYSYTLDYGADGFAGTANGLYVVDDHGIEDVSRLSPIELLGRTIGKALRTRKDFTTTIPAQAGYVFQPQGVRFQVASHNPPSAPLPSVQCGSAEATDCYEVSPDRRNITLRLRLFPGALDGARTWLHGAMLARQVRQDQ